LASDGRIYWNNWKIEFVPCQSEVLKRLKMSKKQQNKREKNYILLFEKSDLI